MGSWMYHRLGRHAMDFLFVCPVIFALERTVNPQVVVKETWKFWEWGFEASG